jgi:cytochrome P450
MVTEAPSLAVSPGATTPPPGPRTPRLWQTFRYQTDPVAYVERCRRRYGPTVALRTHPRLVLVSRPSDVETVLTKQDRFLGGPAAGGLKMVIGRHAVPVLPSGPLHRRERRAMGPGLHARHVQRWADELDGLAEQSLARLPLGRPVATRPDLLRLSLEAVARVLFPIDADGAGAELHARVHEMMKPLAGVLMLSKSIQRDFGPIRLWSRFVGRRDAVDDILYREIAARRATDPESRPRDVLSLLLAVGDDGGEALEDVQVRDELLGLLIPGYHTTGTALAWTFERLAHHPEVVDRLERDDDDRYLDAVIHEVLRTRPPVIDAVRLALEDCELDGHLVPRGSLVAAMIYLAHHDPEMWPDAYAFRPERYLDSSTPPPTWIPFGGGTRRCIGASLGLLIMRRVLKRFVQERTFEPAGRRAERARLHGPFMIPARDGRVVLRARSR